jgi:hypothetical protein
MTLMSLVGCASFADPRPQFGPTLAMIQLSNAIYGEAPEMSTAPQLNRGAIARTLGLPSLSAPYTPSNPANSFDDSMMVYSSFFAFNHDEIAFSFSPSDNMTHATMGFGQSKVSGQHWSNSHVPFRHFDTPMNLVIFTPVKIASRCNCLRQDAATPYKGNGLLELNYPANQGRIRNIHMASAAGHNLSGSFAFSIDSQKNSFMDGDAFLYLSVNGDTEAQWRMTVSSIAQQTDPPHITGHLVGISLVGGMWMIGHFATGD